MQRIYKLEGTIQHYSWGGYDFIPALLGKTNEDKQPCAEYWLGAHLNYPSNLYVGAIKVPLPDFITQQASDVLGKEIAHTFASLPYLLKVLDVRQMLSIQVHPSKIEAQKGFKKENAQGIALTAPQRNYKDENHKPELMVALSPFWLLHGFKSEQALQNILEATPELQPLLPLFQIHGYKGLYESIMTMPQAEVNTLLQPLANRVIPLFQRNALAKTAEDFWAAKAIISFCKKDHFDRGIFSIYFFNLIQLNRGEGVFQPAGMPHAYLEGQNVEIMANSDNVLRAGLTDKHMDVQELLKHTVFAPTIPEVLTTSSEGETYYAAPVKEFGLYQYEMEKDTVKTITTISAEIFLVIEGSIALVTQNKSMALNRGEAALVCAATPVQAIANAPGQLFRATIGTG